MRDHAPQSSRAPRSLAPGTTAQTNLTRVPSFCQCVCIHSSSRAATRCAIPLRSTTRISVSPASISRPFSRLISNRLRRHRPRQAPHPRLIHDSALILTDLEEVVTLLERNVQDNLYKPSSSTTTAQETDTPSLASRCAHVKVEALAWDNSAHPEALLAQGPVDFVVARDLVYFPELYPPLLSTLREITTLEARVLFGYKEQSLWKETPFWEEFGRVFRIEVVRITKHKKEEKKKYG
ncbi:hypothetical protein BG006_006159 [Podila minutissima]|uniref:S-adenosyl-L-methionine-dependent methyltransferase n=1 Tax=Podila minutissima TaxID=64525 RepID=A0A9P5SWC2_9FUNG|nr:hypothetical protein BG006_006159 [Podila minutissima]